MPDEMDQKVDEMVAADQAAANDSMAQAAPTPEEPLAANRLTALSEEVATAAETLSGGQVQATPESFTEDQEEVPTSLFGQLMALTSIAGAVPEGEQYQFNPAELVVNNAGLAEAGSIVGQMGGDKALKRALANAQGAPPEDEGAEAPEANDDDLDEYM